MKTIDVIAYAYNGYKEKFGIPRQSGLAKGVITKIVFEKPYRRQEALCGIDRWSHLWLIWGFSENENKESLMVRPPRLGGNKRVGVFATRSPFRPNGLGLSAVKLEQVCQTKDEGIVLLVSGADLMNGTPIYDIKPYLPYADIRTDANNGFAENSNYRLKVSFPDEIGEKLPPNIRQDIESILSEDPRPQYKPDGDALYGLTYDKYNIRFNVKDGIASILTIEQNG